ncbi:MAG: glutaredoxin domain-containing protein [Gammaproteobacteria bacterium]
MPAEPPAARRRGWLFVVAILGSWVLLLRVLNPDPGEALMCERDVVPDADTVVMLSAAWCGYCREARAWLKAEGIRHCEYDVETSVEGRRRFAELPLKVVPAIRIRDDVLIGFNRTEIAQTLAAHGLVAFGD